MDEPRGSQPLDRKSWIAVIVAALVLVALTAQQFRHRGDRQDELADHLLGEWVEPVGAPPSGSLEGAEQIAATFEAEPDSHGAYFTSARALTREFGAELLWSDSGPGGCAISDLHEHTIAYYCPRDPYVMFLNRSSESYPDLLYSAAFVDFVRHELAHHLIDVRCGTPSPANTASVSTEAVTNSYAVLFLGADRGVLARAAQDFPTYAMSQESDAVATEIHTGDCG